MSIRLKGFRLSLLVLVAVLLTVQAVSAHSIYVQSGRFKVSEGRSTPMFFGFGHHFPVDDAVRSKKLNYIKVYHPDGKVTDVGIKDEKSLHSYNLTYEKAGTHAITAETNPGYFAMYIDKKGRKRHSLKPMNTFINNAEKVLTSLRSSQWAKTYVVAEEPTVPFPANIGLPMEIVPLRDVTGLKIGDTVDFQIYNEGKPYTGKGTWDATYNGFSTEAEDMYIPRTVVEGGKFSLKISNSDRWFIRYFTKVDAKGSEKELFKQNKRTATLVFQVRNERKRPKPKSH